MSFAPGIPSPRSVERWLRGELPAFAGASVVAVEPFAGGASNITCRVDLAGAPVPAVVLRLQRERGIFEPYDVLREGEVLRRLHGSAVPVPALLGAEPDPAPLGAPFLVMEWVDAPHMGDAGAEASFTAFAAMVATIHTLDWRAHGLDVLGVPTSTGDALHAELDAIEARRLRFAADREPTLRDALAVLRRTLLPASGRLALCQGDSNAFNYLFRAGRVVAVVDWEQARISDPRSDIGQLVALAHLKGAPFGPVAESPFVQVYAAAGGSAVAGLEWFRARWLWELGVIYHGWLAFNAFPPWYGREQLLDLLQRSLAEL